MRTIPITPALRAKIDALCHCTLNRDWDRRFVRTMNEQPDTYLLSSKQAAAIDSLYRSYQHQIAPQPEKSE